MKNFTLYWKKSGKEQKYIKILARRDIISLCPRDPKKCYGADFEENIRLNKAI